MPSICFELKILHHELSTLTVEATPLPTINAFWQQKDPYPKKSIKMYKANLPIMALPEYSKNLLNR